MDKEEIGKRIVDSAYVVHHALGPGLLESVYEACFCHELGKHGLQYKKQISVPIQYDGLVFNAALRLDVLVEDLVICELKSVDCILPIFSAQLLSYMRLSNKTLGYLINFNTVLIKNGIKRLIL